MNEEPIYFRGIDINYIRAYFVHQIIKEIDEITKYVARLKDLDTKISTPEALKSKLIELYVYLKNLAMLFLKKSDLENYETNKIIFLIDQTINEINNLYELNGRDLIAYLSKSTLLLNKIMSEEFSPKALPYRST